VYGLDGAPNFEEQHWHLRIVQHVEQAAAALGLPKERACQLLQAARSTLLARREQRVRPGRDEKILTSWNALMIHGMAHAGRILDRRDWLESARGSLDFVRAALWNDGRLLATYKDGRAHLNAYLDDHAFLLAALLELLQADFRKADLEFAVQLADVLLSGFEDGSSGGFFFTSHEHEPLILRPKPGPDHATPSGNGIAALSLQRLGHLVGEPRYLEAAQRTLQLFFPQLEAQPGAYSSLSVALDEHLDPPGVVVLRGEPQAAASWVRALAEGYAPRRMDLLIGAAVQGLPPALDKPVRPGVNAWVCHGVSCMPPVSELSALTEALQAGG
jgi:uncharacterized protein